MIKISDKVRAAQALEDSLQIIEKEQLELAEAMTSLMLRQHLLAKRYFEVRKFIEKLVPHCE